MQVPLLDLKAQYETIKPDIERAIESVANSQHFVLGETVERFEKAMMDYTGARYAIGVASGSDALLLSLMALHIKPGDEVVTTAFSFFATAGCIARSGAKPVFVDIQPDTFNIDPPKIADYLKKNHKRVKAIMPVHLYGQCADIDEIMNLAQKYNIPVVEDAAQAIGSIYHNKHAGNFGVVGCFSFFPSKNLGAWGDGGLVTTNDAKYATLIKSLRVHGGLQKYYHQYVGMNSRLDALQAAILSAKLKYLDQWNQGRIKNARHYVELIKKYNLEKEVVPPVEKPGRNHTYHQFTIRVSKRDELRNFLKDNGIATEVYYPLSLHLQECFRYLGYKKGDLVESEKASAEVLSLPIYAELTAEIREYIISRMREFYK